MKQVLYGDASNGGLVSWGAMALPLMAYVVVRKQGARDEYVVGFDRGWRWVELAATLSAVGGIAAAVLFFAWWAFPHSSGLRAWVSFGVFGLPVLLCIMAAVHFLLARSRRRHPWGMVFDAASGRVMESVAPMLVGARLWKLEYRRGEIRREGPNEGAYVAQIVAHCRTDDGREMEYAILCVLHVFLSRRISSFRRALAPYGIEVQETEAAPYKVSQPEWRSEVR